MKEMLNLCVSFCLFVLMWGEGFFVWLGGGVFVWFGLVFLPFTDKLVEPR